MHLTITASTNNEQLVREHKMINKQVEGRSRAGDYKIKDSLSDSGQQKLQ